MVSSFPNQSYNLTVGINIKANTLIHNFVNEESWFKINVYRYCTRRRVRLILFVIIRQSRHSVLPFENILMVDSFMIHQHTDFG